jgi:hypothetical protein
VRHPDGAAARRFATFEPQRSRGGALPDREETVKIYTFRAAGEAPSVAAISREGAAERLAALAAAAEQQQRDQLRLRVLQRRVLLGSASDPSCEDPALGALGNKRKLR